MTFLRAVIIFCAVVFLCTTAGASAESKIERIAATANTLRFALSGTSTQPLVLVEVPLYEEYSPQASQSVVWRGHAPAEAAVPRFDGKRDRLYSKFLLLAADEAAPSPTPHYVTNLSALHARSFPFPWVTSKKGLTCPVDLDDVIALGTKYVNDNITLSQALDIGNPHPGEWWEVDGERFPINTAYFARLDTRFKKMTDAGINITVVINNSVPTTPDPRNPFIHPKTDLAKSPNHLGAFNLTTERGYRAYRAVMEYFANRYSRPDCKYGWITGYIVGNELQAHWDWYNMGSVTPDEFLRDYLRALRVTDLAVRKFHAGIRVYVSMDHHWTLAGPRDDTLLGFRGDELLKRLNAASKCEGDFSWNVAFHPYPENLFEPRFWNDKLAWRRFDTLKITFKNLEVLPAFLAQKEMRYDGKPRRIILSEQGFHAKPGTEGETAQAAAYAAAYYKVNHLPTIDAFMLHRHVSHRGEGGLRLGLWMWDETSANPSAPGKKLPIYDVFRQADTEQWEQAFVFAKPVIGIRDWRETLPKPIEPMAARTVAKSDENIVFDFVSRRAEAKIENCLDWRINLVPVSNGTVPEIKRALFQHPKEQGVATATYVIALPKIQPAQSLIFQFATGFTGATRNGARFGVRVKGQSQWTSEQTTLPFVAHSIDLTAWAGSSVELSLCVDALGDNSTDWANWLEPRIVVVQKPNR